MNKEFIKSILFNRPKQAKISDYISEKKCPKQNFISRFLSKIVFLSEGNQLHLQHKWRHNLPKWLEGTR